MKNKKFLVILLSSLALVVVLLFFLDTPYRKAEYLVKAIKQEDCKKVEVLLRSGVDPNVTTASDAAELLLHMVEASGERPLSVACHVGNLEIVQMLIDYGATAEPYDKCGWSPLNEALFHYQTSDKEIVEMLLKNGADVNEADVYGLPIFNAAAMIPKKYDRKGVDGSYYVGEYDEEVAKGITDIVEMLLEYGDYDVNLKSSYNGATLLITSAKSRNMYLAEYLLSKGCDVNAKDDFNKSALDYANGNQDLEMVKLLKTRDGSLS